MATPRRRLSGCTPTAAWRQQSNLALRRLNQSKSECEWVTGTRRTYCNIFCIINFHLHLPIDPPTPRKKRWRSSAFWPARLRAWASYSRSSTTDHRNYQPYQEKKKKTRWGKDLIIRSFACFSPFSHWFVLLVLPRFQDECLLHREVREEIKQIIEMSSKLKTIQACSSPECKLCVCVCVCVDVCARACVCITSSHKYAWIPL